MPRLDGAIAGPGAGEQGDTMIQGFIIILALTLPVVAALRAVLGRRVQALMLKTSPKVGAVPTEPSEAREIPATTDLRVMRLDAGSMPAQADAVRHAETRQARSLFRRWCIYDAVGVAGVLAAWQLSFWSSGGPYSSISEINWLAAAYLAVIILRYVSYGGRYKDRAIRAAAPPGWFRRWITIGPEYLYRLFVHPQYSWYPLLFVAYAIEEAAGTIDGWAFWAAATVLVPLILRLDIARRARKGTSRRLLILRVFGRDESSTLTFGTIRRYWQLIGSTFTVVDRSYVRYRYRGHSEIHLAIVFFACMAWAWIFGTPAFTEWFFIGPTLSVVIILGYGVALVVMYLWAPRSFAASGPQIRERLQQFLRRPRRWDLSYKDLDMYCFDNTWREAVAAFVASSNVVLMDLRGYTVQNKGCETEISFLFDQFPIGRTVLLVDSDNDMSAVEHLVRGLWQELSVDSPNLAAPDPVVTVYNIGDLGAADVKGLINTLVAGAILENRGEVRSPVHCRR